MQLLLSCDHLAYPLWNVNDYNIGVEDVPISEPTRRALRQWARRWDRLAAQDMDAEAIEAGMRSGSTQPVSAAAWEEHERDGRVLWATVQQELGPDWQVGWPSFADGARHVQWTPNGPVQPLPSRRVVVDMTPP